MGKPESITDEYDIVDHDDTALSPDTQGKIRDWLQPTDYLAESGEYRRHLSSQAPGTGLWICKTEEYKKWHDSADHGCLWIKGVPGAGKSVMAASIVQHLQTTEQCPVLYFFFRNIVAANFSARALIQDWLAQLLPYSPKLQYALQSRMDTSLKETSDNDLIQVFLDGISSLPKVYCVGDALDEMAVDDKPFLDKLHALATFRSNSLKLLLTSRPKQYLQSALRHSSIVHISLQQELVDVDIISYLHHRYDSVPRSDNEDQIKQKVIDMVARRAEGLFLYAKLTMDQLEPVLAKGRLEDINALEESLPTGLEETYTSMLAKQRKEHGINTDMQVLVLEAVTHSSRPLRLNELASLIQCVCPGVKAPAGFKTFVITCSGPLVEVLEDETLQVIHHSFTEFLRGDTRSKSEPGSVDTFPLIDSQQAHKKMAMYCLQYLQSGSLLLEHERSENSAADTSVTYQKPSHEIDLDEEYYRRSHLGLKEEKDAFSYREARLTYPFLSYAVENWTYHTSHYDVEDKELFATVVGFLDAGSLTCQRWLVLQWGSTSKAKGSTEGFPSALHVASFAGISELAHELLQQGALVSAVDAQERTPLHWAAANGHVKVVSLLIEHGSDPNAADGRGVKPIHLATRKNHSLVVRVLLQAGVEPETIKTKEDHAGRLLGGENITKGECSILYASQGGHLETVIEMIPFCKPKILEQLLCECCRFGRADAVLAILEKSDVSANATFCGATALFFACKSASSESVKALLDRGANVHELSEWEPRRTMNGGGGRKGLAKAALHCLVETWNDGNDPTCQHIFQMLINAKANIEQLHGNGDTALLLACSAPNRWNHGTIHVKAMRALLEAGADVKKLTKSGETAFHVVLGRHRDPESVRLLVEYGLDPNSRGSRGQTVLQCSLQQTGMVAETENTKTIVKYLLEKGADPNLHDDHGNTAMHEGIAAGPEVFKMLLSHCKDQKIKTQCWFRLTRVYDIGRFTEFVEILLAEGIDIDVRQKDGRTLYLLLLNYPDKLEVLRSHGANPNALDGSGDTILHIICRSNVPMQDQLERFIAEGLDPLSVDRNGSTLLHHAARHYTGEMKMANYVRWLVSLGIPVNAVNKNGCTALHLFQLRTRSGGSLFSTDRLNFVDAINDRKDVDLEIHNKDGFTVLHLAAMRSEVQVATLLAAGANLRATTTDSQNILHLACRARQPNIVSQILKQPGFLDLDKADRFGRTPLHYACTSGNPESVAFLLDEGCDVHAVDEHGFTPLHACAQIQEEQGIWDSQEHQSSWLKGPSPDPLRPGVSRAWGHLYSTPWDKYRKKIPATPQRHFPNVTTIARMLLDSFANVGATANSKVTALGVALQTGCAEFVEIFAQDEALFQLVTKPLEDDPDLAEDSSQIRNLMKSQMILIQPRSRLDLLRRDKLAFEAFCKSPQYVDMLSCNDAAQLINEGFRANPEDDLYYTIVKKIMKSGNTELARQVPDLLLHYCTVQSVKEIVELNKQKNGYYESGLTMTALQLACRNAKSSLLMLHLLVEKVKVDMNARCAMADTYNSSKGVFPGGTALHLLASANNHWQLRALRYLLNHGADVNALDEKGQSALHVAAKGMEYIDENVEGFWRTSAVQILLDHGADMNIVDKQGKSPLHSASKAPEITRELLHRGADTTAGSASPIFSAIYDQSLPVLEVLLSHGLDPNVIDEGSHSRDVHYSLTTSRTVCPLLCAAFSNFNTTVEKSVPLIRALVTNGADLLLPLNDEETMVHFLFEYPEYEVLNVLLQEPCVSRIDFNNRDQRGRTVLMAACSWNEVMPGYSHRHWEPKNPGPPLRILHQKVDATAVDNEGKTALHHLLDNPGMPDNVLIQFINRDEVLPTIFVKDHSGYSPFHCALRTLRPAVCDLLLSKGADILEPDPNGLTTLHYIASQWYLTSRYPRASGRLDVKLPETFFDDCVALWKKFLDAGGSINVADQAGNTPLHTFILSEISNNSEGNCHLQRFDQLFPTESGVDVFAVNLEGETMLHNIPKRKHQYQSASEHDAALFKGMMEKGLDPLKEDRRGRTALDVASACGNDAILALFGRQ